MLAPLLLLLVAVQAPGSGELERAVEAYRSGDATGAIAILEALRQAQPELAEGHLLAGQILEREGRLDDSLAALDRYLELRPDGARAHVLRGGVNFKLARIQPSLRDFDRAVELDPEVAPYLWQRGITQYYAGELAACRQQFESHRRVNPDDVENAAWHFLCVAASEDLAAARRALLPVGPDPREAMSEIYDMFQGTLTPDLVLQSIEPLPPGADAAFYAHLYVGLYQEVAGNAEAALEQIAAAAAIPFPHYMGDVARVHLKLRANSTP